MWRKHSFSLYRPISTFFFLLALTQIDRIRPRRVNNELRFFARSFVLISFYIFQHSLRKYKTVNVTKSIIIFG